MHSISSKWIVALGIAGSITAPAAAQVGHDPAHSPYQDLRWGQFVSLTTGRIFGSGGILGLGPHHGQVVFLRHEFLADKAMSVSLGAGFGQADRNYAGNLTVPTNRVNGPVKRNLYLAEATFQLNLTGGKTWHNLAPYANLGLGLAFAQKLPIDSTGYKFGTRFFFAPGAGVRAFLTRRLYIRVEARAVFWSLTYPATYRSTDPDGLGPLTPLLNGQPLKEWAPAPMIHAGLGYAFKNPFF